MGALTMLFSDSRLSSRVSMAVLMSLSDFWVSPTASKSSASEGEGPDTLTAARVFSATSKVLSVVSLVSVITDELVRVIALKPANPLWSLVLIWEISCKISMRRFTRLRDMLLELGAMVAEGGVGCLQLPLEPAELLLSAFRRHLSGSMPAP